MKIFSKLLLLVGSTIFCLVLALSIVGDLAISNFGNDSARDQLQISRNTVQMTVENYTEEQESLSKMIALNVSLAQALADKDTLALKAFAKEIIKGPMVDLVTICDTQGFVLARGHSETVGDKLETGIVTLPLTRNRAVIGLDTGHSVPLLLGSGTPIRHNGQIVGVVVAGMDISSGEFVKKIKASLNVENTIFLDNTRISTTVMRDGKPAVGTTMDNAQILDGVYRSGKTVFSRNLIAGQEYETQYSHA